MRFARLGVLAVLISVLAACPGRNKRQIMTPEIPHNGNAEARSRFEKAQQKFEKDGYGAEEFERIVEAYPADPIVPWAQLYAGIADVNERKLDAAVAALDEVVGSKADPKLVARAQLFLGIAHNYKGEHAAALPLLREGEKVYESDNEKTEWIAAMAYATAAADDKPMRSLRWFEQLYGRVSPTERAVIVARVEEVVANADANSLAIALDELHDRKGPAFTIAASRLAVIEDQAGHKERAQELRDVAAPGRAAIGLPKTIAATAVAATSGGTTGLVGAVIPLGGKSNKIAEAAITGIAATTGATGGAGTAAVEVRAADDDKASVIAVEDLHRANVIAIVGPIERDSVDAAAKRAEELGVPLLSLAVSPEERVTSRYVFHVRHSPQARARTLAKTALAKGVTRFAIMAPDNGYGETVGAAFAAEVKAGGGTIVETVTYPPKEKQYAAYGKKLGGGWQGLFIPEDNPERLGLVVPAVAAAKHIPQPIGTKRVQGGRPIVLLSTAENLSGAYLAAAGRHSEGALLAPGFYADDTDARQKPFLDRFVAAYGTAPGVGEAYAYDAAQLAASGNRGRAALAAALASGTLEGLTGTIQFDANHRRSDPGVLYTVVEEAGDHRIRVLK